MSEIRAVSPAAAYNQDAQTLFEQASRLHYHKVYYKFSVPLSDSSTSLNELNFLGGFETGGWIDTAR
jgi:hypothetical protein